MAQPTILSYARMGFGAGIGLFLASIIFVFIGMLFFIPGFIILNKQQKKPKEEQSQGMKIFAFVLMGMGVIIAGGLGFGALLGEVGEEI